MSKSEKQVKPEMEVKEGEDNNNNEIIDTVEEVQENNKPKKKIVTEAMKEHLATIRIKALKSKLKRKHYERKLKKKVIEESDDEVEVEEVIIKKSNNYNKLTNHEKIKLAEQSAEDRLKQSLKEDRLQYLLSQIGAKL